MIFRPPFFLPWLYPGLHWRVSTQEKNLYLTFDDGPVPGPTEFVLNELSRWNAQATFFCIGDNVRKHPEVFGKIISAGHTIGNHTYHHLNGWNCSPAQYAEDISQCEREFDSHGLKDRSVRFFRPPYGKIRQQQIRLLGDHKIIMWDVLTRDYSSRYSPDECLQGSIRATRPGSIVVFHDSFKAQKNMEYALPKLMEHFARLEYSFKAIPNA